MAQNTDEMCASTGMHRTSCPCAIERRIQRTAVLPPCPVCMRNVTWSLTRSEDTEPYGAKIQM